MLSKGQLSELGIRLMQRNGGNKLGLVPASVGLRITFRNKQFCFFKKNFVIMADLWKSYRNIPKNNIFLREINVYMCIYTCGNVHVFYERYKNKLQRPRLGRSVG